MENNAEIQALEEQIKNFKDQQEQASKKEEYDALQKEIDAAETKLAAKRAELEQRDKVYEDAQDPESTYTITVDGHTVNFREHAENEDSYQALRIAVELKLQALTREHEKKIAALKESYENEIAQIQEQHKNAIEAADRKYDELYDEFDTSKKDYESRLAAAGEEISAQKRQIEELRMQANKETYPTNAEGSEALAEALRKAQEAKPAIYDKEQLDNKGSKFGAKLAKTGEYIEFGYLEQGKYREVTAEEAARFRSEADAEEAAKPTVPDPASDMAVETEGVPVPEIPFQPDGDTTEQQSDTGDFNGSYVAPVGETVSREEFEELKRRVDVLYNVKEGVAA